jgi:hypothetical protein
MILDPFGYVVADSYKEALAVGSRDWQRRNHFDSCTIACQALGHQSVVFLYLLARHFFVVCERLEESAI